MDSTGTQAPPIIAIANAPTLPIAFSCCMVRDTEVTAMPNAESASASTRTVRASPKIDPCTRRPNSGPPITNRAPSWTTVTATFGMTFPAIRSTDVIGVARSRSHVPQPWSRKNVNPAQETPNATAIPGMANSDPFAPGKPASARAPAKSPRMNATMNSGMKIRKMTVEGSVIITRNSCRMIAPLVRSDMLRLLVGLVVAPSGERQVDGLQVGTDDLDGRQAVRGKEGEDGRQRGGRIGGLDAQPRPVDARLAVELHRRHVALEREVHDRGGVRSHELLGPPPRDHAALVEQHHRGVEVLDLLQVVRRVENRRPIGGQSPDEVQDVLAGLDIGAGGGLVQQQQGRSVQQRDGGVDAPLLSARQRAPLPVEQVRDVERLGNLVDPLLQLRLPA